MRRGFRCLVFCFLFLTFGAPGKAQTASTGRSNQRSKITVWVHDYAKVLPGTLAAAEEEATMVFHHAGVQVTWVDCPLPGTEPDRDSPCHVPAGTADFALRILTRQMAEHLAFRAEDLGFALPCPEGERGCVANVFYHRVQELAGGGAFSSDILSRAMAHEIGHLLLGLNAHSPNGIMRAKWRPDDLRPPAGPYLLFAPHEAERLRAEVHARAGSHAAARDSRPSSPE